MTNVRFYFYDSLYLINRNGPKCILMGLYNLGMRKMVFMPKKRTLSSPHSNAGLFWALTPNVKSVCDLTSSKDSHWSVTGTPHWATLTLAPKTHLYFTPLTKIGGRMFFFFWFGISP